MSVNKINKGQYLQKLILVFLNRLVGSLSFVMISVIINAFVAGKISEEFMSQNVGFWFFLFAYVFFGLTFIDKIPGLIKKHGF